MYVAIACEVWEYGSIVSLSGHTSYANMVCETTDFIRALRSHGRMLINVSRLKKNWRTRAVAAAGKGDSVCRISSWKYYTHFTSTNIDCDCALFYGT